MRQRQRQRGKSRQQRQQHHRGPEQQKWQAGRSSRQQTPGLQQRRRRRQQRLGRAEQRQAGTRGCSRGARSSFAGGSVVTAGFGVFNGVACNGGSG